ncbi:MAG: YdcF family protein [Sandaracinus sp.]
MFAWLTLALAWPLAALALTRAGRSRPASGARFDAIVVLGCRVRADGSASPALVRRIELGCQLLREGLAPKLVVTGGAVGGPLTEAEAARRVIAERALAPLDRVVLEPEARTTRENAEKTKRLLGEARVLVVTSDWHAARAHRLFARHFREVATAGAEGGWKGALREVPLFVLASVRGGSSRRQ